MLALPPDYTAQLNQISKSIGALKGTVPAYVVPMISAFLGFALGLLAEPIKAWAMRGYNRKVLRDELYLYFADAYRRLAVLNANLDNALSKDVVVGAWRLDMPDIDLEPLRSLLDSNPAILYGLSEYKGFKAFVREVGHLQTVNESLVAMNPKLLQPVLDVVRFNIDAGYLDERLVDRGRKRAYDLNMEAAKRVLRAKKKEREEIRLTSLVRPCNLHPCSAHKPKTMNASPS